MPHGQRLRAVYRGHGPYSGPVYGAGQTTHGAVRYVRRWASLTLNGECNATISYSLVFQLLSAIANVVDNISYDGRERQPCTDVTCRDRPPCLYVSPAAMVTPFPTSRPAWYMLCIGLPSVLLA